MPSLQDIKRKIGSVKNTEKITKAMKMVSAAKMRKAQDAMDNAREYAKGIDELVLNIVGRVDSDAHPFFVAKEEVKTVALVVITSDRGLCGAFNNNVIKSAFKFFQENEGKNIKLVIVGKKGNDSLRKREFEILEKYVTFAAKVTYDDASEIAGIISKQFEDDAADEVHMIYNAFKSTALQLPVTKKLLPLVIEEKEAEASEEGQLEYIYEPSPDALLKDILPRYLSFSVYFALLESIAGEHGARMMAMDNASRNAKEMIDDLTLHYNKVRQAAITKEILDIVNGAEALNG